MNFASSFGKLSCNQRDCPGPQVASLVYREHTHTHMYTYQLQSLHISPEVKVYTHKMSHLGWSAWVHHKRSIFLSFRTDLCIFVTACSACCWFNFLVWSELGLNTKGCGIFPVQRQTVGGRKVGSVLKLCPPKFCNVIKLFDGMDKSLKCFRP